MTMASLFHIPIALSDESMKWKNDDTHEVSLPSTLPAINLYETNTVQNSSAASITPAGNQPTCQLILVKTIGTSSVRIWDLAMLVPNLIFFLFLLLIFRRAVLQLRRTNSPIFTAFFVLVFVANVISVLRCVTSIILRVNMEDTDDEDRVMWLVLKFFLLATELSVVTFGLLFGHLDSRTSIRRVLFVTFFISLVYSGTQGTLEFAYVNQPFHNISYDNDYYTLFGHGGMIFWFVSSVCLFLVYIIICILPFTMIQQRFTLPTKKSFFWYCFLLACLNVVQGVGSALLFFSIQPGMCLVNLMAYLYFTGFAPLVYATFLHHFLSSSPSSNSIRFSYKLQVDDDDDVNLPHQAINYDSQEGAAGGGGGGGADLISSVDSTNFNSNPLYTGLNTRPELSFVKDHFATSQASTGKRKDSELRNLTA